MKNRAFTLIELVVPIIIVGVLFLITIMSARNLMNNQKDKTFDYHKKIVNESAKFYMEEFHE